MVFTIPNMLTMLRFMLVPAFLILFFSEYATLHVLATAVFVLASATDWLDGFLARWLQQESEWGKFADPLADKLLSVSLFFALLMRGDLGQQIPLAVPCIVMISVAEAGILSMSAVSLYRGVELAFSRAGKLKTAFQFVTILLALLRLNVVETLSSHPPWLIQLLGSEGVLPLIGGGFLLSTVLTIYTFVIYAFRYPQHRSELRRARRQAREEARQRRGRRRGEQGLQSPAADAEGGAAGAECDSPEERVASPSGKVAS